VLPAGHPDCDDKTGELDEAQRVVGPPTTASNRRNSSAYGQDGRAIAPSPLSALFLARERRGGSSGVASPFGRTVGACKGKEKGPEKVCVVGQVVLRSVRFGQKGVGAAGWSAWVANRQQATTIAPSSTRPCVSA
jgi:hypothetical protein